MNTHPVDQYLRTLTRRQLFQRVGLGVGGFALANLLKNDLSAAPKNPFSHFGIGKPGKHGIGVIDGKRFERAQPLAQGICNFL